jgi:hypothetical protein
VIPARALPLSKIATQVVVQSKGQARAELYACDPAIARLAAERGLALAITEDPVTGEVLYGVS